MAGKSSSRTRSGATDRIVRAVVADIAVRRTVPTVFLLDDEGRPTAWPARGAPGLPGWLAPFLERYFGRGAATRRVHSEVLEIDGVPTVVRIVPYHTTGTSRYAVIAEPFVLRSAPRPEDDAPPA